MKNNKKKSRRKWLWVSVFLLPALLIVTSVVTATVSHYRTITAYRSEYEGAFSYLEQYTKEELEDLNKEINYDIHDTLAEQLPEANMEILNARDRRKLSEGELNPEQTAEIFRQAKVRAGILEADVAADSTEVSEEAIVAASFAATPLQTVLQPSSAPPVSSSFTSISYAPVISTFQPATVTAVNPSSDVSTDPAISPTPTPTSNRSVDAIIEDFYILKSKYVTNLNGVLRKCKAEWRSKPKSEQTFSARLSMAEKCMRLGSVLEAECDAEMAVLMAELQTALTQSGQSTDIIPQIQAVYDNEKEIKKAELIDRYYPS